MMNRHPEIYTEQKNSEGEIIEKLFKENIHIYRCDMINAIYIGNFVIANLKDMYLGEICLYYGIESKN